MTTYSTELIGMEARQLAWGAIAAILETGEILVRPLCDPGREVLCDYMSADVSSRVELQEGDPVLFAMLPEASGKGCVLGKVGAYAPPLKKHLELEADEDLTIRCGKGSITIEKSGRILIKGVEIVSHAQKGNRIRGASIKLN